jgi:hypothetical protein
MNAVSPRHESGDVMFESTATAKYLMDRGVPPGRIIVDYASWDTVANAWMTRMFLESLLAYYNMDEYDDVKGRQNRPLLLEVIVFTSDFHAARTQAAFEWVLGAAPSLISKQHLTLVTQSVSSMGIKWPSQDAFKERVAHEDRGTKQVQENALRMPSASDVQAFLLLGGHGGYFKFTHRPEEEGQVLERSQGAGWS